MRHREYTRLMSEVLDGIATPADAERLRTHLRGCAACGSTWEEWRAVDRLLATAPHVPPPPTLLSGLSERLEAYEADRRRTRSVIAGLLVGLAMLASAVSLGVAGLEVSRLARSGILWEPGSSVAQFVDSVSWTIQGAATVLGSIGWQSLTMVIGTWLVFAGLMAISWLYVLGHARLQSNGPPAMQWGSKAGR